MTYQGARARPTDSESTRVFEVSTVFAGTDGRIYKVRWSEVASRTDRDVGAAVMAPVADVVDAIHDGAHVAAVFGGGHTGLPERAFVVIEHADGRESIGFEGDASPGRNIADLVGDDR